MATKYCDNCGITHTSIMCFNRPRKTIKKIADKTKIKELETRGKWLQANPGDIERGLWWCSLRIHEFCPMVLTIETLTLEHVKPKGSHRELKYDVTNIKPACVYCNGLKGSMSLEQTFERYPQKTKDLRTLSGYLDNRVAGQGSLH